MAKRISKLQEALQQVEDAVKETNSKINELGFYANFLYYFLNKIQSLFDLIRNVPEDDKLKYEELKQISVNWKQQAEKIELEYKKAEVKTKVKVLLVWVLALQLSLLAQLRLWALQQHSVLLQLGRPYLL